MRSSKLYTRTALAAGALVIFASSVLAQTVTGSVTGTVTDPSGAVVPNASIVVINTATGVRTPVKTDGAGVYTARFLPIGSYRVEVSAPGFTKAVIPQFALEINQTAKLDAHLSVGESTNVEVQGSVAPIIDTTDATLGLSLDANEIATVPLNGRNFSSLTQFQPGAVATDPTGLTGGNAIQRDNYNSGVVTINGNRAQDNTYTLDGISIDETQNNLIGYNPSPDALQEVRVISANAPAQYGNVNGGDVVSVLKSGTNKFHGSAFGYLQDQNLEATPWATSFSGAQQPKFTQSTFGGTFGGPIVKNKLFFFLDYEGTRQHQGGTGTATASVLSLAERQGNFSAFPGQLVDPQNGFAPFPNNQIPITNPVVQFLVSHPQYYPLPNKTATDGLDQNNLVGSTSSFETNDQGDIKIEYDPRPADKITAFYSQGIGKAGSINVLPISFPNADSYPDKIGGGTWVHTLSPAVVNEARFGFTRIRWDNNIPTDSTAAFGLNGDAIVGLPVPAPQQFVGFTYQGLSEDSSVGTPASPQQLRDNTYSLHDDLTIQHGRQLFTIGAQFLRYQQNYTQYAGGGQLGSYTFTGQNTAQPTSTAVDYDPADWLLDRASTQSITLSTGFVGERQYRVAGYAQDDWKVTDRLTLNLGLRYEFDSPWTEAHNHIANVILAGPLQGTVEYAGSVPANAPAGSTVCSNPSCFQAVYTEFQPRVGFAFQPNPRIVFRGGYGTTSFYEGTSGLTANAPFIDYSQLTSTAPSQGNAGTFFAETNGFQVGSSSLTGASYTALNQVYRPAYVQEFNFNNEIQLNNTTSIQYGYVGELGQRLIDFRNGNQLTAAQAASLFTLGLNNNTPLAQIPVQDRAPLSNLVGQGTQVETFDTEGISKYNALQITMRHRVSKGFEATVNYTWAKSMTDTNGNYGASGSAGANGIQNGYDIRADYGPSELDVRHNLTANGSYAIPFGRGQAFGSHTNRIFDLLAGGWTLSSTAIAYSGLPITIMATDQSNTNTYGNAFNASRANQYRQLHVVNRGVKNWFGTDPSAVPCGSTDNGVCAYGSELPNTFGTARVSTERAPGYEQIDSSLFKDFHITEGQAVGFRADAFNVMNLVSYNNPNDNVNSKNFGQITSSKNGPRTIQFAAHYSF